MRCTECPGLPLHVQMVAGALRFALRSWDDSGGPGATQTAANDMQMQAQRGAPRVSSWEFSGAGAGNVFWQLALLPEWLWPRS